MAPPTPLKLIASISPPSQSRTWQTRPHPTLPILATACADKTVRISSMTTFEHQATISGGHKRSIRSVAWKPSSGPGSGESVLCTGSFDASAGIWRRRERRTGQAGKRRDDEHQDEEEEQDFTGLGRAGDDEEDEWQFAVVLDGHDSEIKSVSYCPTAPFLATCSRDKSVWIWEELEDDNYETVAVLQEHEGDVKCVAWHPEEVMVASGSYDDSVRLWREEDGGEDWGCAAVLDGFGGTVWSVEFEPADNVGRRTNSKVNGDGDGDEEAKLEQQRLAGPRLLTAADDGTIKVWRRVPKPGTRVERSGPKMPSILKTTSIEEEWVEEAQLPQEHDRAVYATHWSAATGLVVSCGSDGRVVVYEEDARMKGGWTAVAAVDNAHDVYEVNHVSWARVPGGGDEEVVVSTGDDGEVKVWRVERSRESAVAGLD